MTAAKKRRAVLHRAQMLVDAMLGPIRDGGIVTVFQKANARMAETVQTEEEYQRVFNEFWEDPGDELKKHWWTPWRRQWRTQLNIRLAKNG